MPENFFRKWGAVGILSILLLIGGVVSYHTISQSSSDVQTFMEDEYPIFDKVQQLRSLLSSIESEVHHLYATADGEDTILDGSIFQQQNSWKFKKLQSTVFSLKRELSGFDDLIILENIVGKLFQTCNEFAGVMDHSPILWDEGRNKLSQFSLHLKAALEQSNKLSSKIRNNIEQRSQQSLMDIQKAVWIVLLVSIFSIIAAIVLTRTNLHRLNAIDDLNYLAYFDSVTGLHNRQQFSISLKKTIRKTPSLIKILAYIDIDRFHRIETVTGQESAQKIILKISEVLSNVALSVLGEDKFLLARLESSKFGFAFYGTEKQGLKLIRKLKVSIEKPIKIESFEHFVTLTIGYVRPQKFETDSTKELLRMTDAALMQGKQKGGNIIVGYKRKMDQHQLERIDIESGLEYAVERGEFYLVFQPKLSIRSGEIVGAEVLLRWNRAGFGMVSPDTFIPIAEESGKINAIGKWVLTQTCKQAAFWMKTSQNRISIAVNVSAVQLLHGDLPQQLERVLKEAELPPSLLEIEITESAALENFDEAILKLNEIKKMGVKLSLDDFGTGYSSLGYLHKMPIDTLKIDKSFTQQLPTGGDNTKITKAVIGLAHDLGLEVIAEGVETVEQFQQLRDWDCDQIQGYLLGKPMNLTEFEKFCVDHNVKRWNVL